MEIKVVRISEKDIDKYGLRDLVDGLDDAVEEKRPDIALTVSWHCKLYENSDDDYTFMSDEEHFDDPDDGIRRFREISSRILKMDDSNYAVDAYMEMSLNGTVTFSKSINTKVVMDLQ